jgi:hypothetical protein
MKNVKSSRTSVKLRNLSKFTKKNYFDIQELDAAILKIGKSGFLERYLKISKTRLISP